MTNSEPFPRCPEPGCPLYASDAAVSALVEPRTLQRMRQLRNLKPVRAADGRRLFCPAQNCHEPLPPPPPLPAPITPPTLEHGARDVQETENGDKVLVSTCPDCGQRVCMQCGGPEHPMRSCAIPSVSPEERRLYNEYAVGRIGACPRCGVHTVNDEGCLSVSCGRCYSTFEFQPFRTLQEAEDAALEADLLQGLSRQRPVDAAEFPFWGLFILMVFGVGYSGVPFTAFVSTFTNGDSLWLLLAFLPFIVIGVPMLVISWVSHIYCCGVFLRQVVDRRPSLNSMSLAIGRTILGVCMFLSGNLAKRFLETISGSEALWQWLLYILPLYVGGVVLALVAATNVLVIVAQSCMREPHQPDDAHPNDGMVVADVTISASLLEGNRV